MPDWMSQERKDLIRSLGAEIRLVSKEEGGFLGSIRLAEEFAAALDGAFLPRQFSNEDNVEAHDRDDRAGDLVAAALARTPARRLRRRRRHRRHDHGRRAGSCGR